MAEDFLIKLAKKIKRKKKNKELTVLSKPHIPPKSTYKKLITMMRFGHSGSGVINDLLAEFDNTTLYCGHDIDGGSPLSLDKSVSKVEVDFVNWFNKDCIKKYLDIKSPFVKIFRFEDLVLDYDNTIPKVIEFLGLKKENHVAPKTQFRPEYSKKNIGLYKNHYDQDSIKYIDEHLKEFCYYEQH